MARRARLFVVSGPAGVGKGTLVSRVRAMRPHLGLPVSATTRSPRPGEIDGESYHFLSDEEFDRLKDEGEFLEWAKVHDHRYGTLRSEVDRCIANGDSVVLEIDMQGGMNVRKAYPGTVCVFIDPPSWDVLVARLEGRGTESEESMRLRLQTARKELAHADEYDERIVNDDLDVAVCDLLNLFERYENET